MNRISPGPYAEAIAAGLDLLPPPIRERVAMTHWLTGTSPLYVGLHGITDTSDGRSYADTAHACYPRHTADRSYTVVLPAPDAASPLVVVHELGHVLHHLIGLDYVAAPVTPYARTNHHEAFACALAAYAFWYGDQDAAAADRETVLLLDRLAAGGHR